MKVLTAILNKNKPLINTIGSIQGQSYKTDIVLFSKIKTNLNIETVCLSPIDNLYYSAIEYAIKNNYDLLYIVENNTILLNDCIEKTINYAIKWTKMYDEFNVIYSDVCLADGKINKSREYLCSINDNTVGRAPIILDNVLINLQKIKNINIQNLKQIKNNKEYVLNTLSLGPVIHVPEALYCTEFREPSTLVETNVV